MAVEFSSDGPRWVLRLSGIVDISGVGRLHAAAREAARRGCSGVVDLQKVDSLDTSAVQVLLSLRQALAATGGTMQIENTPPAVAEAWERTGLFPDRSSRVPGAHAGGVGRPQRGQQLLR